MSSCNNVFRNHCKARLRSEGMPLFSLQDRWHKVFEMWCDGWKKEQTNSCRILIQFDAAVHDEVHRFYVLLCRASFSPKASYYISCEPSGDNVARANSSDIEFPFDVSFIETISRVCPDVQIRQVVSSDELALQIARCCPFVAVQCYTLQYYDKIKENLKTMVVTGRTALPVVKAPGTQAKKRNADLDDLKTLAEDAKFIKVVRGALDYPTKTEKHWAQQNITPKFVQTKRQWQPQSICFKIPEVSENMGTVRFLSRGHRQRTPEFEIAREGLKNKERPGCLQSRPSLIICSLFAMGSDPMGSNNASTRIANT